MPASGDERRRSGGHVLPSRRQGFDALVIPREAVDATLDQDQPELGVLVFTVAVEVLADGDRLLDQIVQILRQLRRKAIRLQYTQNLVARNCLYLRDAEAVAQ
eukprot:CAMPEP_0117579066 /NCGR_PEP_ID=MMETSP0784-20121206/64396_1 /TAXON_ID=39447 /ORGANISM="" /LENGTH=102 /DNA_ID=CAMNT_0005378887 /DNA_START=102 /DNA_END=407 /DNA_ORIENTATION=+